VRKDQNRQDVWDAKFAVTCDRPCKAVQGEVIVPRSGMSQTDWGTVPEHPEVAAFGVNQPNPMPADFGYLAYVESEDEKPVKITKVGWLTIAKP